MLIALEEFVPVIARLKQDGKRIVFTNGCFDIIHVGHIRYLKSAKELGDILVIGLNSDESVRKIKGDNRPIVSQGERAEILSSIRSVDYVVIFNEPDPYNTIVAIKPDILIKGGDWAIDNIVGRDIVESYGGEVRTIPFVEGFSSSRIIGDVLNKFRK
ncbi:MAG: glycerol-3-phosphate cytidylyltransferase [Nitrospirae bacterium GWA2_42_11]|nr:MAG: glycerol-3-phosphate cytidylyltransferase [Nitrospirae bacterium GWA2_42_11]HAS16942.1 D-glycero-beta-D-manno-heptose 1-phosphate adenylyltransferase [Nitrospiraceae bacterium]